MTSFFARVVRLKKTKTLVCGVGIFVLVSYAHAAGVSFIAPANIVPVGSVFHIEVHLETGNDGINVVDGIVDIPKGIHVTNIETGNSLLSLWPTPPTYEPAKRQIIFTGGVPNGLHAQTDTILFRITAIPDQDGSYQFVASSTHVYENDGAGTIISLSPSTVTVHASGVAQPSSQVSVPATPSPDLTPPIFAYVEIGRDLSLFNNEYYVTFQAHDAESGIDYYEVKEGLFGSYARANRYYVLQDQTLSTPLVIRAVDRAGNRATWIVPPEHTSTLLLWEGILVILVIVLVVLIALRKRRAHAA